MINSISSYIVLFLTFLLSQLGAQEVAQVDLSVVKEATIFHLPNDDVRFRTMINHTAFIGNDDTGNKVEVKISFSKGLRIDSVDQVTASVFNANAAINVVINPESVIIELSKLEKADHIDIELDFGKIELPLCESILFKVEVVSKEHDINWNNNALSYCFAPTPEQFPNKHIKSHCDLTLVHLERYPIGIVDVWGSVITERSVLSDLNEINLSKSDIKDSMVYI